MRNTLWFLLFIPYFLFAQNKQDERILKHLCSPALSGRGYVNSGDSIAAEFIAKEFRATNLKTFKRRTYFQPFQFLINTFPGALTLKINGNEIEPGKDYIVHPASPSFNETRQTIFFDEYFASVEKLKVRLRALDLSKHILVLDKLHFDSPDASQQLQTIVHEMSREMPVIVLTKGAPIWFMAQNQRKFPVFEINREHFALGKIEIRIEALLKKHNARNVIARIPAKGKAKQRIIFSAHYDHLGKMGEATFYPGANDNASGVTLMLNIARKLAKQKRTSTEYVFMAFAGEEVGLLGSQHFVKNPWFKLNSIRFLLNLDIFGGAHLSITAVNGTIYQDEFKLLQDANEEMRATPEIKVRGETANSDHHWFHANGVPCFFLYTAGNNMNYHVPFDEPREVDLKLLDKTADMLLRFVSKL
jgi:aminopeptidase YwaD